MRFPRREFRFGKSLSRLLRVISFLFLWSGACTLRRSALTVLLGLIQRIVPLDAILEVSPTSGVSLSTDLGLRTCYSMDRLVVRTSLPGVSGLIILSPIDRSAFVRNLLRDSFSKATRPVDQAPPLKHRTYFSNQLSRSIRELPSEDVSVATLVYCFHAFNVDPCRRDGSLRKHGGLPASSSIWCSAVPPADCA